MKRIVLLRHGESAWNQENRFTGWKDVDLTPKGAEEARAAGRLLEAQGYDFDFTFTSVLKRAIRTLNFALAELFDCLESPVGLERQRLRQGRLKPARNIHAGTGGRLPSA